MGSNPWHTVVSKEWEVIQTNPCLQEYRPLNLYNSLCLLLGSPDVCMHLTHLHNVNIVPGHINNVWRWVDVFHAVDMKP